MGAARLPLMIDSWAASLGVTGLRVEWPWMLCLLPAPILWWWLRSARDHPAGHRPAERGPDEDGVPTRGGASTAPANRNAAVRVPPALRVAFERADGRGRWQLLDGPRLAALAWVALVIALAQPTRPGPSVVTPVSGRAITLAIDVSGSMEREDFELDGVQADRLSVVKRAASDFIAQRQGDRVALVLFGKEAFVAAPLTFDLNGLVDLLASAGIGMAGRSTAIGDALGLSLSVLRADPAAEKAIVLLSDGTNNAGPVEPEDAAELATTFGVRVHTIALGSDRPSTGGLSTAPSADLDEATLKAIAEQGGGRFFRARTTADLFEIYTEIDRMESAEDAAPPTRPAEDLGHWPRLALFALLLLGAWRESTA